MVGPAAQLGVDRRPRRRRVHHVVARTGAQRQEAGPGHVGDADQVVTPERVDAHGAVGHHHVRTLRPDEPGLQRLAHDRRRTPLAGLSRGVRRRWGGQQGGGVRDRVLGETAVREGGVGDDAAAVLSLAADLHAGGERQRRADLVVAAAHQYIGEVDVGGAYLQQDLAVAGRGLLDVREPHHLARLAVLVHLPSLHAGLHGTASSDRGRSAY